MKKALRNPSNYRLWPGSSGGTAHSQSEEDRDKHPAQARHARVHCPTTDRGPPRPSAPRDATRRGP